MQEEIRKTVGFQGRKSIAYLRITHSCFIELCLKAETDISRAQIIKAVTRHVKKFDFIGGVIFQAHGLQLENGIVL